MPLTEAQYATLANDVLVVNAAEFSEEVAATDDELIAVAYNQLASPDFWVLRTAVSKREIVGQTSQEGTIFTWAGNGFITRSVQELLCWRELFDEQGLVNPSLPQVKPAFLDIFSGSGNAALNRTHLGVVTRRKATRLEKLFATTPGTGTTASPATMQAQSPLTYLDIAHALRGVPI